jgi:hypothetical protein
MPMHMSPRSRAADRRERLRRGIILLCVHESARHIARPQHLRDPSVPRQIRAILRQVRVSGAILHPKGHSPDELCDFIHMILRKTTEEDRMHSDGYKMGFEGDFAIDPEPMTPVETKEDVYDKERFRLIYDHLDEFVFCNNLPPFDEVFAILATTSSQYLSGPHRLGELHRQSTPRSHNVFEISYTIRIYCQDVVDALSPLQLHAYLVDELVRHMISLFVELYACPHHTFTHNRVIYRGTNALQQLRHAIARLIEKEEERVPLFEDYAPNIIPRPTFNLIPKTA